jgi:hypothetical protein
VLQNNRDSSVCRCALCCGYANHNAQYILHRVCVFLDTHIQMAASTQLHHNEHTAMTSNDRAVAHATLLSLHALCTCCLLQQQIHACQTTMPNSNSKQNTRTKYSMQENMIVSVRIVYIYTLLVCARSINVSSIVLFSNNMCNLHTVASVSRSCCSIFNNSFESCSFIISRIEFWLVFTKCWHAFPRSTVASYYYNLCVKKYIHGVHKDSICGCQSQRMLLLQMQRPYYVQ